MKIVPPIWCRALYSLTVSVGILAAFPAISGAPSELPPDQIYSGYSRNFIKSIEWPESAGLESKGLFTFCILGDKEEISLPPPSKWNFPLPVSIVDANGKGEKFIAESCQALFIATSEEKRIASILGALNDRPVLTISPIKRFASRGGMFGMVEVRDRIRFTVNRSAIDNAGLRLTKPDVMKLAVEEPED